MWTRLTRLLKHRWQSDDAADRALPPELLERLTLQVKQSEATHSGEIRLYVEASLPLSYLWRRESTDQITHERALAMFGKLRVWDTENNNGVLIYLLLAEHRIEIVADRGLNQHVSPETWQELVQTMRSSFINGDFGGGLGRAVQNVSTLLQLHFSIKPDQRNPNELPDQPLVG